MAILESFANRCDQAISDANHAELLTLIPALNQQVELVKTNADRALLHYFLGNVHAKLVELEKEVPTGWRTSKFPNNLIKWIDHLRLAASLVSENNQELFLSIQTNLANGLAFQGRSLEVIDNWKTDFLIDGDSPYVSSLKKGRELFAISYWLNDDLHTRSYQYEAYLLFRKLSENLDRCNYSELKASIKNDKLIAKVLEKSDFFDSLDGWDVGFKSQNYKKRELAYRTWSLQHKLFVNPLIYITNEWIADRDIMQFPNYRVDLGEGPYLAAAFSSLKREYCFARYLTFESICAWHPKFEDKQLFLVDTYDEVRYEGSVEKMKAAFRICFGVLDSIAALINHYFQCDTEESVFQPVWIKKKFKDKPGNPFIDALFWQSCELYDHDKVKNKKKNWNAPKPSSPQIRRIRNAMEHGWLRVAEKKQSVWDNKSDYAYVISYEELKNLTISLLKMVNTSMLYLRMSVTYNEKLQKKDDKFIIQDLMPMVSDLNISEHHKNVFGISR